MLINIEDRKYDMFRIQKRKRKNDMQITFSNKMKDDERIYQQEVYIYHYNIETTEK